MSFLGLHEIAGAVCRSLTVRKDGPSLYDVCDPVLQAYRGGDAHLGKFYRTALGNPPLRALLRRTGLPALNDPDRLAGLRAALTAARDVAAPDWAAIGTPVAALMDGIGVHHPAPPAASAPGRPPEIAEIDRVIRLTGAHLLRSFGRNGFIPTYAAFNLIGDPDVGGRELLMALTGLNARGYKNSTLLFNLARIFTAHSPARALINPAWRGIAEPMWEPVQIRHRSAYYDAFFTEALLGFVETGLAAPDEAVTARRAIADMVDFCLKTSAEEVASHDGSTVKVITALAPGRHPRFSRFFAQIKQDLGFGIYVPDCDTTACSFSAATQAGSDDPILQQPLLDFYRGYQVRSGANEPRVTVPLNDHLDYDGGVVTWIDNLAGERPYGNDLDPTLNLDILEVSFRNLARWQIIETPQRLETVHRIIAFQKHLVESGAFKNPRSHIYYLPELYSAYFGRCYAAFVALPLAAQRIIDPGNVFALIRARVLGYVTHELIAHEMNPFDAALALMALAHLGAEVSTFTPALHCIVQGLGEGGRKGPYRAYEWNKMKTPTRILVGGPEVTSAFVLMALALARRRMVAV
ncbi:hypothetical protein M2192_006152 [Bradyrhizobium elkanii USDA 61]|uniref:Uncharacterized protein n=1 Tax=Bradyrhizobium elkanii TaxID=29448 RepID=A0A8I1Y4C0_BRAEL|nr:hypothetical protein [Bradyrhizobium elkanii]MCS4009192.1 hypothetical protein [Bradyrhizobium elkanii USDA 61]MCP1927484.1 hypothetical protein [Bradyrhizobium elkanii]MCS3474999.1 hypothetical protein [Bradyrhizobium elkanii]MCS3581904.1 hypothetical protein [Bradyrhizobium elkanii]